MKKKKAKISFAPNPLTLSQNIKETAERFSLEPSNDWYDVCVHPSEYRLKEEEIARANSPSIRKYSKS